MDIGIRFRLYESDAIRILQTKYEYTNEDIEESRAFPASARFVKDPPAFDWQKAELDALGPEERLSREYELYMQFVASRYQPLRPQERFLRELLSQVQALRELAQAGDNEAREEMGAGIQQFVTEYRLRNPDDPWGKRMAIGHELIRSGSEGGKARALKKREQIERRDAELIPMISDHLNQNPKAKNSTIAESILAQSADGERFFGLRKSSLQALIGKKRRKLEL